MISWKIVRLGGNSWAVVSKRPSPNLPLASKKLSKRRTMTGQTHQDRRHLPSSCKSCCDRGLIMVARSPPFVVLLPVDYWVRNRKRRRATIRAFRPYFRASDTTNLVIDNPSFFRIRNAAPYAFDGATKPNRLSHPFAPMVTDISSAWRRSRPVSVGTTSFLLEGCTVMLPWHAFMPYIEGLLK